MRISTTFGLLLALFGSPAFPQTSAQTSPSSVAASNRQERDDYRAALAASSGAALEKSAREFAEKYPQSSLRRYVFLKELRQYQSENDGPGMVRAAHEVLVLDPTNPLALVLTATVLADQLSPRDPERDKQIAEIRSDAEAAIRSLEHGVVPVLASAEQVALYRSTLQAMAHAAIGVMKLKTGDDSGAEKELKAAAQMTTAHPDPYIWYNLALAQDHRKKFSSAINSVEQAMQLASANPQLQRLAEREHDRLLRLSSRSKDTSQAGGARPPE